MVLEGKGSRELSCPLTWHSTQRASGPYTPAAWALPLPALHALQIVQFPYVLTVGPVDTLAIYPGNLPTVCHGHGGHGRGGGRCRVRHVASVFLVQFVFFEVPAAAENAKTHAGRSAKGLGTSWSIKALHITY